MERRKRSRGGGASEDEGEAKEKGKKERGKRRKFKKNHREQVHVDEGWERLGKLEPINAPAEKLKKRLKSKSKSSTEIIYCRY